MMAKRPFTVSEDEEPVSIPTPTDEELEQDTKRLVNKFDRKYGKDFSRLLAALKAKPEESNGDDSDN